MIYQLTNHPIGDKGENDDGDESLRKDIKCQFGEEITRHTIEATQVFMAVE